jgi:hypothetical protein
MSLKTYFANQDEQVNNEFLAASGDWNYADDIEDNEYEMADGSWNYADDDMLEVAGSAAESLPYILQIYTTSATAITNVDLFNAFATVSQLPNKVAGFTTHGQYAAHNYGLDPSIWVSCLNSGVTYDTLLYQSMNKPFAVGKIYLQSASTSQLTQPCSITTMDASGKLVTIPFTPTVDPMQNQTQIVVVNYEFVIDGYTKFTINNLLAATNAASPLTIRFYPKTKMDARRAITRGDSKAQYGAPNIQQVQKMIVANK